MNVHADAADHDTTLLAGQKRALELALHGAPLSDVFTEVVMAIERQSTAGILGSILLLDATAGRLRQGAAPSLPADDNAAIDGIAIGPEVGSCGTAAFTGKTVVVEDIEHDPLWREFKGLALAHGLRACWSTPIFASDNTVLGTFALYHRIPAVPTPRDREIVEVLGRTVGLLIERDRHARERAAVEAALRATRDEQAARITAMFQHAPAAIAFLRGPDHVYEVANPAYDALVGGRSLLDKSVREVFPEFDGQGLFEVLDTVYRTGQPYIGRAQRVMLRRDPSAALAEAYFDFVYQPIPGPAGAHDDVLVVANEVTDLVASRLAAEAARQRAEASEQALKTFLDNLPELAWTARADGHIDYYNRRWYEYTGTTFEEIQGWGWEKLHDPEMLPQVVERWRHSLATGEPFEMEFTLRGADDIPRWFLTRVAPTRDTSGRILRWFGTNTNIDAIRAAQALTAAMAEQSHEVERKLLELRAEKELAEQRLAALARESPGTRG